MPVDTEDETSKGLRKKLLVAAGFLVSLGALVSAINTILTGTKPWVCGIGLPFSWCEQPRAADTWSIDVGGIGGSQFDPITCGTGQVLVGLSGKVRSDDPFIYAVGPICAVAHFDRKHHPASVSVGAVSRGDEVGSDPGKPFELKCPPNTVVVGSELSSDVFDLKVGFGWQTYLVAPLVLKCSSVLSSEDESKITRVPGAGGRRPVASKKPFSCPDGLAAFGIRGRNQAFVDAIALGCRDYR
jgi:hypothetical protein